MKINHKITITNLGPIGSIENFEVKNINILIGESGTGKSVIAKTIFTFNDFFNHPVFSTDMEKSLKEKLEKTLERFFYDYEGYKIKYFYSDNYYIDVNKTSKKFTINFSKDLQKEVERIEEKIEKSALFQSLFSRDNEAGKLDKKKMEQLLEEIKKDPQTKTYAIKKLYKDLGIKETLFIPASRSFVLDLNEVILNSLLRGVQAMDSKNFEYMMLRFADEYSSYSRPLKWIKIHKDFHDILKGSLVEKDGQIIFKPAGTRGDKNCISLSSLSSGQKEVVPIAVILSKLIQEKKPILLIVEEPEAHLFPTDQLKIFEILVYFANISKSELIITTHSPYICYKANNMLLAHGVQDATKNKTIKPKDCQVSFLKDGTAESIINDGEIDTDYIDSASVVTIKEYHRLIVKKDE
jgi:predicted ATPase